MRYSRPHHSSIQAGSKRHYTYSTVPDSSTVSSNNASSSRQITARRNAQMYRVTTLLCLGMAVIFLFDGNSNGALVPKERSQNRIRALGWDRMSSRSGRRLQTIPQSCYENMLVNGDFESGTANWSIAGIVDTFTTNLRQDGAGGSHALFQDRYVVTNGIQQGLATPEALPCFDGEGFYFRITADLRLYDPTTGEGISACRNDRQHNYMTHCPRMKLWVRKANGDSHTFEVHDANMVWNANGWNQFDVIFQVPEHFNGMGNINCIFTWFGAQPDVAYLVDNVVLRRVEHADLPDGHHIWTQDPLDCNDNIFVNDDGEYQSPYGWQAFGHWSSDYTLTVVEDGSGSGPAGTGFALVALDRLNPYNTGPGQWFNAKSSNMPCFDGFGYYFRIEGDVRLYDQSTGVGVTTCSPQDETTIRNCPRLHLTVQREGEKHASSAFYDEDITTSWNPTGWNHIDMIVAMQPLEHDPPIQYVRINYLGGPPNSVLMLDRARARRISYEEIPAGHPVFSLTQAAPLMESPIKTCKSSGDPHYSTFGGTKFDYHELGWHILYEKGGLRVEAHHAELPGGSIATLNDSVRVTYQGTEYIFSGGNQPLADEYYDPESRMLTFPSPEVKVSVSSRYFFQGSWINNVFVTTSEIAGAVGLCVDENSETDAIIQAGSPPIVYDPNGITEEEAQAECSALNGTAAFNDCVMDYRLAANAVASSTDSTEGSPSLVARSFVTSSVEVETIEEELQEIAAQEVAAEFAVVEAAVNGDPTILGLKGQAFKFEGKSDAWYANLSTKSVQWNLKFHQFPSCPAHEDMMISGLGLYIEPPAAAGDEGYSEEGHSIQIKVNEDKFTPGCPKTGGTCLGEGSLEIIVDGDSITQPGEYLYGRNETAVRVIAYNTFASCSRRWFDFNEQASSNTDHLGDRKRILFRGKKPAEILFDSASKLLDADDCFEWVSNRQQYGDFFLQQGAWSTVFVETNVATFHIEYRQSNGQDKSCPHHSIDAWMTDVSPRMKDEEWQGVLGETREPVFDGTTGERVMSDRDALLRGKHDRDYEVDGPHGKDFRAKEMGGLTKWLEGVGPFALDSLLDPLLNQHRKAATVMKEEYYVGHHDGIYHIR